MYAMYLSFIVFSLQIMNVFYYKILKQYYKKESQVLQSNYLEQYFYLSA